MGRERAPATNELSLRLAVLRRYLPTLGTLAAGVLWCYRDQQTALPLRFVFQLAAPITFDACCMGPVVGQDTSRQTGSTAGNLGYSPADSGTTPGSRHSKTGKAMKLILQIALAVGVSAPSNQKPESQTGCPMHDAHTRMNERGEKGTGFSQTAAARHFLLHLDGAVIQVETNDSADATNRNEIRMHLVHIAKAFQSGDFRYSEVCSRYRSARGTGNETVTKKYSLFVRENSRRGKRCYFICEQRGPRRNLQVFCASRSRNTRLETRWMSYRLLTNGAIS
jgi:hypothetical protein